MNALQIAELVEAKRPDLADGFPIKLVIKAFSTESTVQARFLRLASSFSEKGISLNLLKSTASSFFSENGILEASTSTSGEIVVNLSPVFFTKRAEILEQAYRLQSVIVHELIHKQQLASLTCSGPFKSNEVLVDVDYINDPYELEAMAGEIVHDLAALPVLGKPSSLAKSSSRLDFMLHHARFLTPESISLFQRLLN